MPSFLIRGLARYIAASAMERRSSHSSHSYTPIRINLNNYCDLSDADLSSWSTDMRWLIPFVQATGYQIVLENPKSHEKIIIDQDTKELPSLTLEWMRKYNKQELLEWIEKEKERKIQEEEEKQKRLQARRIAEVRGRARFGNKYVPADAEIQDALENPTNTEIIQYQNSKIIPPSP